MATLGLLETEAGRYAAAESLLNAALKVHRNQLGPHDRLVAIDLQGLGMMTAHQARSAESMAYYLQALAIYETYSALQDEV